MAATLFKLVIDAQAITTVQTKPTVQRFFYTLNEDDIDQQGKLSVPAASFVDDMGDSILTIPLVTENNGYKMLFINGVLQQESLYTITDNKLEIENLVGVLPGETFILVVINFAPEASSQITVVT